MVLCLLTVTVFVAGVVLSAAAHPSYASTRTLRGSFIDEPFPPIEDDPCPDVPKPADAATNREAFNKYLDACQANAKQRGYNPPIEAEPCHGTNDGAQVTIRNDDRKTIAVATLRRGTFNSASSCVLKFTARVPDASFYAIDIQGHRGTVTLSKKHLERAGWRVQLR
jgi:hypothetical protein